MIGWEAEYRIIYVGFHIKPVVCLLKSLTLKLKKIMWIPWL